MTRKSRYCCLLGTFLLLGCMESPPSGTQGPSRFPHGSVGGPAPEIEGEDAHGNSMRLSDFRGKVVLLEFWKSR
jgi:hypothetical protein